MFSYLLGAHSAPGQPDHPWMIFGGFVRAGGPSASSKFIEWMDSVDISYHLEYVVHTYCNSSGFRRYEMLFVVHVNDQDSAFQIRMHSRELPLKDGWRERFAIGGRIPMN